MFTQKFIKIFHSVQEIGPFPIYRIWRKASTDDKFDFAIPWDRSCQYQCSAKFYQTIPNGHFQNLALGKASADDKCHFAIPCSRSCQYQCVFKFLSKYSKRFKSYKHFSQTVRRQLGKASTDVKCHFAISWAKSYQYQCLHKSLSKYSIQFKR